MKIIRDSAYAIDTPNLHDCSITALSVGNKEASIEFENYNGDRFTLKVTGIIEIGITDFNVNMSVGEAFLARIPELCGMYISEGESPWRLSLPSYFSMEDVEARAAEISREYPHAMLFWIDCNCGGFIAIVAREFDIITV